MEIKSMESDILYQEYINTGPLRDILANYTRS